MGSTPSAELNEEKMIDGTGNVNNNIIIQEARDTHSQLLIGEKLLWATYVLIALEFIKFILYFVRGFKNHLKKKYNKNNPTTNV